MKRRRKEKRIEKKKKKTGLRGRRKNRIEKEEKKTGKKIYPVSCATNTLLAKNFLFLKCYEYHFEFEDREQFCAL